MSAIPDYHPLERNSCYCSYFGMCANCTGCYESDDVKTILNVHCDMVSKFKVHNKLYNIIPSETKCTKNNLYCSCENCLTHEQITEIYFYMLKMCKNRNMANIIKRELEVYKLNLVPIYV